MTMPEPAGNKLFNVEARAFVLEMRKAGLLVDRARRRGDHHGPPPSAATSILPHDLAGDARRGSTPLWRHRRVQLRRLPLGRARGPCSTSPQRARPGRARPILARIARLLADDQPAIFLYQYVSSPSMAACTTVFAWVLTRPLVEPVYRGVLIPVLGLFGLMFGLWYVGRG
jgi:hypothetical protein